MYHEVFHEVRVHTPAYDDDEVDPLVSFNRQASRRPDKVFRTDTGFTTADVYTTDNVDVHEILSDDGKTELQVKLLPMFWGWGFVTDALLGKDIVGAAFAGVFGPGFAPADLLGLGITVPEIEVLGSGTAIDCVLGPGFAPVIFSYQVLWLSKF